ncbi:integrator complex subunit 10 isoform X2 [Drosophila obscura]|uniref:integrator complex subunit 10 isoform X2 n=1 Tax=Drosophila obscura TaxID=7282 RepID=UPI000BA0659D|nr:integrator complex subunit 10 isoform X2 [Drosophila obscura]
MTSNEENELYMVKQAQSLRKSDPDAAQAWIMTAKMLYPSAFNVQYESYLFERDGKNYEEAAKCFSVIATKFPNRHTELWQEINALTTALRNENESTPEQEFFVKMYKHLTPDVQHNIFMHTINHCGDDLEQCICIYILMFKKFPKSVTTHAPRLLELLAEGMTTDPDVYQRILVEDVLPMIQHKPPELAPVLACRLYTNSLEYYLRQIMDSETEPADPWKTIFKVLMLCGQMMGWEPFLPFSKQCSQNVYWEKLVDILSASPPGSSKVLFYATTLFIYSLYGYIRNCRLRIDDSDVSHVLVEGFIDGSEDQSMEPPKFSLTTPISPDLSNAFLHAAQCWQLLNTDQFQRDFSQLMVALPLAPWISRFLFDLAIYFGHRDEANKLMGEMTTQSSLVQSLQILSLNLMQGSMTLQGFQCILKVIGELPATNGHLLENMTLKGHRHMVFLPLTRAALVQYCTGAIVSRISRQVFEPNCSDRLLGDLLVLQQLNLLNDTRLTQQIFSVIKQRVSSGGTASVPPRRIGTRGADKGARDEFKTITRQQIARCNENIITLLANFITQEQLMLAQHIFGIPPVETIEIK